MSGRILRLASVAVVALSGCETASPDLTSEALSPLLEELLAAADRESSGDEDGPGAISSVMSARISRDERQIFVLDKAPPLIKIFDRDGRFRSASVNRGGGPNELEGASNIAVGSEHAVVIGQGRVKIRRLSDGTQYSARPAVQLFDVGFDCGNRLVGYGPNRRDRPDFVHVLAVDTNLTARSSGFPNERPSRIAWQRSIFGTREGSLIVFRGESEVRLAFLDCAGAVEPRRWDWAVRRFPSQRASALVEERRDGSRLTQTFDATAPLFAGAADLKGQLLWIETRMASMVSNPRSIEDYENRTYFYLADSSTIRGAYATGSFGLEDISENALLLGTSDPWPRVLMVGKPELLRALEQAGIVAQSDGPGV